MSKYDPLWKYITKQDTASVKLTFADIGQIVGMKPDHSFLSCKKELSAYGWKVGKISIKTQTVLFEKQSGTV